MEFENEQKKRIVSQPVIMQTVENIWSKHDTEKTGYLNTEQAKRFICETLQTEDISDEDFSDFYNKFATPHKRGINKDMMARYVWHVMNDDPFAEEKNQV